MASCDETPVVRGLVLGKFAPFTKGHEFMVDAALADCDEVVVIAYDSPYATEVPLNVRADWIRDIYSARGATIAGDRSCWEHDPFRPSALDAERKSGGPSAAGKTVIVLEGWDAPADSGDTDAVKALQERYLHALLSRRLAGRRPAVVHVDHASGTPAPAGGDSSCASSGGRLPGSPHYVAPLPGLISAFYSGEFYGAHVAAALGARDARLDRSILKGKETGTLVSGTLCRAEPFAMLREGGLSGRVYRDMQPWIVFLGAPSCGKSTITAECARAFSSSTFMPEYGREYWETHAIDRRLTPEQLVEIALGHAEREEAAARACDGPLFIDTNAVTTAMFALDYHGAIHPQLARLADAASSRYDVVFLCCDDIPYEDTADRSGPQKRSAFQRRIVADLQTRRIPFHALRGSVAERMAQVAKVCGELGIRLRHTVSTDAAVAASDGSDAAAKLEDVVADARGKWRSRALGMR